MKEIPLSNGMVALVDDEDWETLSQYRWHANPRPHRASRGGRNWYAYRQEYRDGTTKTLSMHRQILGAKQGQDIDHRDGNGLNNCRSNLRFASKSQNMANRDVPKPAASGFRGVSWRPEKSKWYARINAFCRTRHLGYFHSPEQAARAYDRAAAELFGDFARLNFPEAA